MIAFCGLSCTDCAAFIATQKNNDNERKRVAELWSKLYRAGTESGDINCDGCLSEGRRLWVRCSDCPIRKCGLEKHIKNCAYCDDYACEKLDKFFDMTPVAKSNLEKIRKSA
jgi:hypothetical protein